MLTKLKNKKAFTLMEMLIVVAIIAILVAIAIPTFASALNKARSATDVANIRSGYASAQIAAMTEDTTGTFYLQNDGTVAATGANDYVCKGDSDHAQSASIAGQFTAGADVTGTKGNKVTYTVGAATGDGQASVTAIAGSAA